MVHRQFQIDNNSKPETMTNRINGLRELTPTVADEELANERRRRTDQISRLMGEHLLRGYTMLNEYCARCAGILMQDRNGAKNCIACEEVDGIGRVDEHPQMRMDDVDADTDVQHRPSRLIGELRLDESGGDAVAQLLLANNRNRMQPITTRTSTTLVDALTSVENKMKWAVDRLNATENVIECTDLVKLITNCSEMITMFE